MIKHTVLIALLSISMISCLSEDDLKRPFVSFVPIIMDDGWELSTPEAESVDGSALHEIYDEFHSDESIWQARSLLVFRNGKLIAESYTKDDSDRTTPRAIWSCTKQVMGILTGIAIDRQLIGSVGDSISEYLLETDTHNDKRGIRIEHLLTMSSGISYSNDGLSGQTDDILRLLPDRITDFILSRPLTDEPGAKVSYKDCDPQVLSAVIQSACEKPTSQWAKEVLFDPLAIKNLQWDHYKDGTTLGGFGILTTPREMAKFGQLVLDSGMWKDEQIVSKEWIETMTSVHVEDVYSYGFGYLWWIDESRGMVFMSGHGGQYVCIIPNKKLLVTITAEVNTQGDFQLGRDVFEWVDRIAAIAD